MFICKTQTVSRKISSLHLQKRTDQCASSSPPSCCSSSPPVGQPVNQLARLLLLLPLLPHPWSLRTRRSLTILRSIRTITDRFYYKDGELIHQFSETLRWEFDGTTQKDQNGNEVPGIINHVDRYRYYVQKFSFSSLEVQPAEENFPLLETAPPAKLPYRTKLAQSASEEGTVDCSVFQ